MKSKIKICGIQFKEEIEMINQLPIDYIGFVFAPSKRRISIEQGKILKNVLNDNIKTVGVFVNESSDVVNKIAHTLNLDVIQLHGEEDEGYISTIERKVWKAYKINKAFKGNTLLKGKNITGNLFDGKNPGSGEVFNWEFIKKIESNQLKILAGGLKPENIERAIKYVRPDIIDVSSGVEKNNKKNELLLNSLVRRIQNV
jgi:phosphoribosylanthranilate isomerase